MAQESRDTCLFKECSIKSVTVAMRAMRAAGACGARDVTSLWTRRSRPGASPSPGTHFPGVDRRGSRLWSVVSSAGLVPLRNCKKERINLNIVLGMRLRFTIDKRALTIYSNKKGFLEFIL